MKKLFASLMAATMVAGMSVSAFAYVGTDNKAPDNTGAGVAVSAVGDGDDYSFETASNKTAGKTVYGGNSIYFPILVNAEEVEDDEKLPDGYFYATKASEVEDLKVSFKETEGKGSIKSAEIVRVKAEDHKAGVNDKIYCIKVKLNDYFKTEESELEFDLTLKEKGKEQLKMEDIYFTLGQDDDNSVLKGVAAVNADKKPYRMVGTTETVLVKCDDSAKAGYGCWYEDSVKATAGLKDTTVLVDKDGKVTADGNTVKVVLAKDVKDGYGRGYDAKFKDDLLELTVGEDTKAVTLDEWTNGDKIEELYMETADGEMIVEGKLEEQDALFLGFETEPTDFQKAVMTENDKADVEIMNWVARPTFDFNMDVTVPVDEDEDNFLYEEIDGKLVEVEAKLNDDGDELTFKTKTLGKYLLSDKELTAEKAEEAAKGEDAKEEATEKEDGKKESPETGASIVAVATAIALF